MNKENALFGIIGVLLGLIIGFMFANYVNRSALPAVTATTAGMPAGMPAANPGMGAQPQQAGPTSADVQAAADKANQQPDNFDAQMTAAEMYYRSQKFSQAIEFLKKANQLKPDDYDALVQLGNANFDADNYPEAEKWYTQALAKKPDDVDVRTDLGLTFVFRDPPNYDRAIQEFKRGLEKNPKHIQALQNLTVAYTKKNDAANAKATLARLEAVDPSNKAIEQLRGDIQKLDVK